MPDFWREHNRSLTLPSSIRQVLRTSEGESGHSECVRVIEGGQEVAVDQPMEQLLEDGTRGPTSSLTAEFDREHEVRIKFYE